MKRCQKLCRALPPSFGQNPKECILFLRRTSLKGKREKSFQCCWISGFSRNRRNMIYFHSASIRGSVRGISFSLFVSDKCFREMFQMIRGRKDSADKNYLGFQDQNFGRHFFLFSINKSIKTLPWAIRYEATKKRTCHDLRYIVPTVKES